MATTIFCLVTSEARAWELTSRLRLSGFTSEDISFPQAPVGGIHGIAQDLHPANHRAAAASTGTDGADGQVGWLIDIRALDIPEIGPYLAAGPIMAVLSEAAIRRKDGGLAAALIGMGVPPPAALRYEKRITSGHILICVHGADAAAIDRAKALFAEVDAEDIAETMVAVVAGSASSATTGSGSGGRRPSLAGLTVWPLPTTVPPRTGGIDEIS